LPVQCGYLFDLMTGQQFSQFGRIIGLPTGAGAHHQMGVVEQLPPAVPPGRPSSESIPIKKQSGVSGSS